MCSTTKIEICKSIIMVLAEFSLLYVKNMIRLLVNCIDLSAPSDDTDDERPTSTSYSFFSIEYYQQFFNVDTTMVLDRIASSMIPKRAPVNYLKQHIGTNPDLYGPFWIVVTLVNVFY